MGDSGFFRGWCLGLTVMCVLDVVIPNYGVRRLREDAIKNNVAEYYLDEQNEKAFRWKKPVDKPVESVTMDPS